MRLLAIFGKEPAKVSAPKPARQRRMKILVRIGDEMMMTVMRRPPKGTFLIRRCSSERDQKLENSAGAVSAMRQQAMKAGGNCKHAHDVKSQAGTHRNPTHAGPDDQQTGEVHEKELRADEIIEFFVIDAAI